jgi:hypothetical protein
MKICNRCEVEKPETDFVSAGTKNGVPVRKSFCKQCHSKRTLELRNPERAIKANQVAKAWQKANPEKHKQQQRRSKWKTYGIDPDLAEAYYQAHDGRCEICNEPQNGKALAIDHCHTTGQIRGMLCSNCNLGIGNFKDSQRLLVLAIDYLNRKGS